MDNNKKIKELEKQIEELKKNQDGLYRCIEEVRNDLIDTNLMSVLMAPLFPEQSRNCLWILRK